MYETFFGFDKRPFLTVPTLDRYFPASSIEQAYQTASRCIHRGEGPVAIIGGTGLGKTMCCLRIADSFRKSFEVVMLASSQICVPFRRGLQRFGGVGYVGDCNWGVWRRGRRVACGQSRAGHDDAGDLLK